ncbi:MAG TPA: hypothetical protein PLE54_10660 [Burkholderiaceae bacterium]|nr:hypothetical protein [Burkholderiaceae bacterium]HQR71054.1 hypothetical protein [Burkholderiaceae bacterium]
MTRRKQTLSPVPEVAPPTDDESSRVVARPDGYYWVADDGRQEFGPFASATLALAALREGIESALEEGQSVAEAEAEIGIAEWVDPDTGQPAEEVITRLEDH